MNRSSRPNQSGELQRALDRRGLGRDAQAWLEAFRSEHNHLRPHEALAMRTPAQLWHTSPRCFDLRPPDWQYPPEAKVLKVDCKARSMPGDNAGSSAKPCAASASASCALATPPMS